MVKVRVVDRSIRPVIRNPPGSFLMQKMRSICARKENISRKVNQRTSACSTAKNTKKIRKIFLSFIRQPWERYVSVIVHVIALIILSLMIVEETKNYTTRPTGTAVDDDMYPIQKIDFPAIAICNINVLSRKKVSNFAHELWERKKVQKIKNMTLEKVEKLLKYMGHFFTFNQRETEADDIQLLEKILVQAFGPNYIVPKIMDHVTPQCRQNFDHCSWAGSIRSCEELFIPRWTQDGLCCTFNYVRWTEDISEHTKTDYSTHTMRSETVGYEYGLRVLLNPHFDDNYYNIMAAKGFKILIYAPTDYPDKASGGLKEHLIGPGIEHHLKVKGTSFYSSPDVINYDKEKRQCLFNTELEDDFGGTYSYSQCLMLCRIRDILKTCGCVPFYYPYSKEFESIRDCRAMDLGCLETSWFKWHTIKPSYAAENLWTERKMFEDSLSCNCLPTCEANDLTVFHTASEIHHYDISLMDFVQNYDKGNVTKDAILLQISFELPTIVRLRQDVLYYWYDLLSAYGGLCGLFLGISIITPIEQIYQLYLRLSDHWKESNKLSDNDNLPAIIISSKLEAQPIYWKELIKQKQRY